MKVEGEYHCEHTVQYYALLHAVISCLSLANKHSINRVPEGQKADASLKESVFCLPAILTGLILAYQILEGFV